MTVADLATIAIPCFNAADTIGRAIRSARNQDWPNLEIIVVDDLSSDASVSEIEKAIAGDPRARLIRHDVNKGPAGARNTALAAAAGTFIAFFDDDDESAPTRVSAQIRRLLDYEAETGAEQVACFAAGRRLYDNGYVLEMPAIGARPGSVPTGPAIVDALLTFSRPPDLEFGAGTPACALLLRRAVLQSVGGFDAGLRRVEDADLAIRLGLRGGHFIGTEEPLFTQHATFAVDKSPEKNLEAEVRLAEKNRSYLESRGLYFYAKTWPKLRYWHFRRRYGRFILCLMGLLLRNPVKTLSHLLTTGPRRLAHERRMRPGSPSRGHGAPTDIHR